MKELKLKLSSAPALLVFRDTPEKAAFRGTILFYHGLKACKETNMKEYLSLAERGFLAVGIDNFAHGERQSSEFENFLLRSTSAEGTFLDMVCKTVEEVPAIIDELVRKGISDPEKIGICGISMGGYITYGAILADKRIKAATPVLGSPVWMSSGKRSPHNEPKKFFPVALLAQNAGKDESVPPQFAREFHSTLIPYYKEAPERLCYIEYPLSKHFMLETDWNELWNKVLSWFDTFISL
ncbi:MAG TPA: prolyl oligopeptidase family serine peptidase [Candidatus Eremiobacteraeota bacterium]|nr:MAG: esterase [bacterium ADurb.Bin363]HPZ08004.1 prolyl oligopeptidase family serine peptidase [Candidatus Eremiobacteraeota bacterium]